MSVPKSNAPPMPIKVKPYEHQVKAYEFALHLFGLVTGHILANGCAFLMEMGTGKSLTSIGVEGALYKAGKIKKVLVVAPLSILSVWEEEHKKFAAFDYELVVLQGPTKKKQEQLKAAKGKKLQVVVVNYESAWRMEKDLIKWGPDLVIADEGHKMKEPKTSQSKGMHNIGASATYRLLLTGTLISNKELDVFSQYKFCEPRVFGTSFYTFRNKYFDMKGYGGYTPVFKKQLMPEFLQRLHSIAFRVTKNECLDLPTITEEERVVVLETKTRKIYDELLKESFVDLGSSEASAVNILTRMLRLSQITGGHLTDDEGDLNAISTAKLDALSDIIDSYMEEGKKLVIMARFVPELRDIENLLDKKGIKNSVIRGEIKNRDEQIRSFQEDPECMVFVGQIAAAGLGITLTAASTIVFYSLDYSMANFSQAQARIHRVSQTENCHYIYLVAKDTVDIKIIKALRNKLNLARLVVDDYRAGRNPYKEV